MKHLPFYLAFVLFFILFFILVFGKNFREGAQGDIVNKCITIAAKDCGKTDTSCKLTGASPYYRCIPV